MAGAVRTTTMLSRSALKHVDVETFAPEIISLHRPSEAFDEFLAMSQSHPFIPSKSVMMCKVQCNPAGSVCKSGRACVCCRTLQVHDVGLSKNSPPHSWLAFLSMICGPMRHKQLDLQNGAEQDSQCFRSPWPFRVSSSQASCLQPQSATYIAAAFSICSITSKDVTTSGVRV